MALASPELDVDISYQSASVFLCVVDILLQNDCYDLSHNNHSADLLREGVQNNPRHGVLNDLIYGPVQSRRFGRSLGVNLLPPGKKLCSFDCVYCQLGWNDKQTKIKKSEFPTAAKILKALQDWFANQKPNPPLDSITFSGNGEPTLNPHFPEIAQVCSAFVQNMCPTTKLILLTNASQMHLARVQQVMPLFSEVCVKWDPAQTLHGNAKNHFVFLKNLPNLVLQSCVFAGEIENFSHAFSPKWWQPIIELQPKRVDLYTVAPPTADPRIRAVPDVEMQKLKQFLMEKNLQTSYHPARACSKKSKVKS